MYLARPELGIKRTCSACAVKFYDLMRTPARCPACQAEQAPPRPRTAAIPRSYGTRWPTRTAPAAPAAATEAEAADDDAVPMLDGPEEDDEDDDDAEVTAADKPDSDEET